MKVGLFALVMITGILNTVQTGCNATLQKSMGGRWFLPAAVTFAVGLVACLVAWMVSGERAPGAAALAATPWWAWVGGVSGALYIVSMMVAADKLGAAVFMGVTVTLAILTSLVMDHYGLMGFEVHRAGVARLAGGALMVSGLLLIARF